jgi:hypothetical protein
MRRFTNRDRNKSHNFILRNRKVKLIEYTILMTRVRKRTVTRISVFREVALRPW